MDKSSLTERDICTKFIIPSIVAAGWDLDLQVREEVAFTKGRVVVRGKLHSRGWHVVPTSCCTTVPIFLWP